MEHLSSIDPNSALTILERISPIVFNISKFTDGDETRHSKHTFSSLVAKLNPQTAASIYDQELTNGEWYYAEETIVSLIERCDFSSPIVNHLYLTGLHSSCYQILREKFENGHPEAKEITVNTESLLGINVQSQGEKMHSKIDEFDEKITLQPSDYPPECFEHLSKDLKGKVSTRKFWKSWYAYWCGQGRELELLKQLTPFFMTFYDRYDNKRYLLDLLYFSQRKLNGKAKAFDLLVTAHNAMNGWSDWYESEENSINRLKIVAEQYSENIDNFVRLTTSQPGSWNDKFGNLIIPNDKLVFLLAQSGRNEEAFQLTLSMVKSLEDSVRNLKLSKPNWDWSLDDSVEEALTRSLVSRLKLPIPSVKLWVLERLSLLLIDEHPKIEDLLKAELSNRKQESECVEVLCVFYIAKSKGYVCPNNLGSYIKARSTLSDLLLFKLISNPKEFGTYAHNFSQFILLEGDNNRFEYFQGNHVPLLYNSRLENEEQRTGIPFTCYYQSEWNNTFKYQPSSSTNIDYFLSSDRQRTTAQFYTQASHRGRSAYLRTIEVAKQFYGMPDSYAEHLSILALPIEPAYIGFNPQKPIWLPEWGGEKLPNRDNLTQFVEQALANFVKADDSLDLLALSLPMKLDDNNWIDLTVVKAIKNLDLINIQIEDRSSMYLSFGSLLDKNLFYDYRKKDQSEDTILACMPFPLNRYGHWYSDLETRGLYLPLCDIDGKNIIGSTCDGVYCYYIDDIKIGFSSFWYNDWQPNHPKELKSLCGTFTAVEKDKYSMWYKNEAMIKCVYICHAKVLKSKDSYRKFDIENHDFSISI